MIKKPVILLELLVIGWGLIKTVGELDVAHRPPFAHPRSRL